MYLGGPIKIPEATILYNESKHNILALVGKARQGKQTNKPSIVDKTKALKNYPNWNLSEGKEEELEGAGKTKGKGTDSLSLSLSLCLLAGRFVVFPPLCTKVRRVVHHFASSTFCYLNTF